MMTLAIHLTFLLLVTCLRVVSGVDRIWKGTDETNNFWDVATNWDPAQVPSLGDNAIIASPGTTVNIRTPAACNSLTMTEGTVAIRVNGTLLIGTFFFLSGRRSILSFPSAGLDAYPTYVNVSGSFTLQDGAQVQVQVSAGVVVGKTTPQTIVLLRYAQDSVGCATNVASFFTLLFSSAFNNATLSLSCMLAPDSERLLVSGSQGVQTINTSLVVVNLTPYIFKQMTNGDYRDPNQALAWTIGSLLCGSFTIFVFQTCFRIHRHSVHYNVVMPEDPVPVNMVKPTVESEPNLPPSIRMAAIGPTPNPNPT